ncbi:hypothetical protein C8R44DRAFT_735627 [Mycena epipterygia]|nr:hypothetical protein C8R44DRAFT_735627 [Mycena epipterygia]
MDEHQMRRKNVSKLKELVVLEPGTTIPYAPLIHMTKAELDSSALEVQNLREPSSKNRYAELVRRIFHKRVLYSPWFAVVPVLNQNRVNQRKQAWKLIEDELNHCLNRFWCVLGMTVKRSSSVLAESPKREGTLMGEQRRPTYAKGWRSGWNRKTEGGRREESVSKSEVRNEEWKRGKGGRGTRCRVGGASTRGDGETLEGGNDVNGREA